MYFMFIVVTTIVAFGIMIQTSGMPLRKYWPWWVAPTLMLTWVVVIILDWQKMIPHQITVSIAALVLVVSAVAQYQTHKWRLECMNLKGN